MNGRHQHAAIAIPILVVWATVGVVGGVRADEATLIHAESGGFINLEGETRVRISAMSGTIAVRTGKSGELRYEVRSLDNRREERPVGLWLNGKSFEIAALEETGDERLLLEMAVPPDLAVEIDLDDSNVQVAGLRSDLLLIGAGLKVDARGIHGDLSVRAAQSDVKIDGVAGDADIDSEAIGLVASRIEGALTLTLLDSEAEVRGVTGEADADIENTVLSISGVEAELVLRASGGRVQVEDVKRTSDLNLSGAPLVLNAAVGRSTIETDGEVRVGGSKGPVVIRGYGGPVMGNALESSVEIAVDQAVIDLEDVKGAVTISGSDLEISLKNLQAEATVRTAASQVRVEGAQSSLQITNEFGPVEVHGTKGDLKVVNRDADVVVAEAAGSVDVFATAETVDVGWETFPAEGHQVIANEFGGINVTLPNGTRCRIEAQSKEGRISSDIPTVRINDDEKFASGVIGGGRGPTIQIRSQGDVSITGATDTRPENLPTQ
jgi:hypothetical protein